MAIGYGGRDACSFLRGHKFPFSHDALSVRTALTPHRRFDLERSAVRGRVGGRRAHRDPANVD